MGSVRNDNRAAARETYADLYDRVQELKDSGNLSNREIRSLDNMLADVRIAKNKTGNRGANRHAADVARLGFQLDGVLRGYEARVEAQATDVFGPVPCSMPAGVATDVATSGSKSTTSTTSGDFGADFLKDNASDGKALLSMYESSPEEFAKQWRELSAEDRQLVMFTLQNEIQLQSQLTTMFTNVMQAAHTASMAVARNLSA